VWALRHQDESDLDELRHLKDVTIHEEAIPLYEGGCGQEDLVLATVDGFDITGAYLDQWWRWIMVDSRPQITIPGRPPPPEPAIVWPSHLGNTRKVLDSLITAIDKATGVSWPDDERSPEATCTVARVTLRESMGEPRAREDLTSEEVRQWYDRNRDRLEVRGEGLQLYVFASSDRPDLRKRACEARATGETFTCSSAHSQLALDCHNTSRIMSGVQPRLTDAGGCRREVRCSGPERIWEVPEEVAAHSSAIGPTGFSECIEGPGGVWYLYESYEPPLIPAPEFEGAEKRARNLAAIDWNRENLYEPLLEVLRAAAVIQIDEDKLERLDHLPLNQCPGPPACRLGVGW